MVKSPETFLELMREVRKQLGARRKELPHEMGAIFAAVNRSPSGCTKPLPLATRKPEEPSAAWVRMTGVYSRI